VRELSLAGARVRLVTDAPPGCVLAGHVTGVAGIDEGRLLLSDAAFTGSLPREAAIADARNQAAAYGVSAIAVDGHAVLEYHLPRHEETYLAIYARAFRCP
jgi:hypothetical protein